MRNGELLWKSFAYLSEQYAYISGGKERVSLHYDSSLHQSDLATQLAENTERDRSAQYTTAGIHKDDLLFEIEGYPMKKYGSQGQQKSFLIALKLSQFEVLKQSLGITPIVLLDDIFDKLDDTRVTQLVQFGYSKTFRTAFYYRYSFATHRRRSEANGTGVWDDSNR